MTRVSHESSIPMVIARPCQSHPLIVWAMRVVIVAPERVFEPSHAGVELAEVAVQLGPEGVAETGKEGEGSVVSGLLGRVVIEEAVSDWSYLQLGVLRLVVWGCMVSLRQ